MAEESPGRVTIGAVPADARPPAARGDTGPLVVVVTFLNEEWSLPTFLDSVSAQTRPPDKLVLVDDGSIDRSPEIAEEYARGRGHVVALRRPQRAPSRDRLAQANELKAFQWAVEQLDVDWAIVAKMDADLRLSPRTLEAIEDAFAADPRLGMAGAYLSELQPDRSLVRLPSPAVHVRGATKFYRRACWTEIAPLPAILGWDTIDEAHARLRGWRTRSIVVPDGDPVHLRRTGGHGPMLRSFRRWGVCSWGSGAHPLHVLLYGLILMRGRRPRVIGGLNYLLGWAVAALRRAPRASSDVIEYIRRDEIRRIRARARRTLRLATAPANDGKES
jgi:biofilm PGA synthesis N-glycosyltransferase PgaC